ncbi:MAG: hypothetical protein ACK5OX_18905 [Desertimonas sp.]
MRRRTPRATGALAGVAIVAFMTGCQTGQRPSLGPAPVDSDDPNVDAVVERLEPDTAAGFHAEYRITAPGGSETTATVDHGGAEARTVTIAEVRYEFDGEQTSTCDTAGACRPGIDAQALSEFGLSPTFYGPAAAARLRRDAGIRVGPTTASTETIAGQTATCVTVPIADTASVFCALDGGPLARWRSTDVTIELTAFATA